eukprot:Skav204022  [mRNA]  locus=scaffold229:66802:67848:+ [translate_table: standard]
MFGVWWYLVFCLRVVARLVQNHSKANLMCLSCQWKQFLVFISLTFLYCLFSVTLTAFSNCRIASEAFVAAHERATYQEDNKGVIMWSYGRSATGSFMKSLSRTSQIEFCNGNKESFQRGPYMSSSGWQECADRGELLVHVTPTDLVLPNSTLRTPYEVFQAAYKAGFRTLVTNFRQNQLAREVSAYRQNLRKDRVPPNFDRVDDLIARFEGMRRFYIRGVEAGQEIGLTVVPCRFANLVEDVCPCVEAALSTLTSPSKEKSNKCRKVESHVEDAKKEKTLESLVPPEVAAGIREQLRGTAYEWMLNLEAMDWPKDVAPPVPMPTWRLNPCTGLLARLFSFEHQAHIAA